MRKAKLTSQEQRIEEDIAQGEYQKVSKKQFNAVATAIQARKKDAVLNIRVNKQDLDNIKKKARQLGVKYQTFISEFIHTLAQS